MQIEQTQRGFNISNFKDRNGYECSIQQSSIATENCIWLGINKPGIKYCVKGMGWQDFQLPEGVETFSRMHLSQEQVKTLLPFLQKFAETGELE